MISEKIALEMQAVSATAYQQKHDSEKSVLLNVSSKINPSNMINAQINSYLSIDTSWDFWRLRFKDLRIRNAFELSNPRSRGPWGWTISFIACIYSALFIFPLPRFELTLRSACNLLQNLGFTLFVCVVLTLHIPLIIYLVATRDSDAKAADYVAHLHLSLHELSGGADPRLYFNATDKNGVNLTKVFRLREIMLNPDQPTKADTSPSAEASMTSDLYRLISVPQIWEHSNRIASYGQTLIVVTAQICMLLIFVAFQYKERHCPDLEFIPENYDEFVGCFPNDSVVDAEINSIPFVLPVACYVIMDVDHYSAPWVMILTGIVTVTFFVLGRIDEQTTTQSFVVDMLSGYVLPCILTLVVLHRSISSKLQNFASELHRASYIQLATCSLFAGFNDEYPRDPLTPNEATKSALTAEPSTAVYTLNSFAPPSVPYRDSSTMLPSENFTHSSNFAMAPPGDVQAFSTMQNLKPNFYAPPSSVQNLYLNSNHNLYIKPLGFPTAPKLSGAPGETAFHLQGGEEVLSSDASNQSEGLNLVPLSEEALKWHTVNNAFEAEHRRPMANFLSDRYCPLPSIAEDKVHAVPMTSDEMKPPTSTSTVLRAYGGVSLEKNEDLVSDIVAGGGGGGGTVSNAPPLSAPNATHFSATAAPMFNATNESILNEAITSTKAGAVIELSSMALAQEEGLELKPFAPIVDILMEAAKAVVPWDVSPTYIPDPELTNSNDISDIKQENIQLGNANLEVRSQATSSYTAEESFAYSYSYTYNNV